MNTTIVLTGGGSGGHITPLLAVATELKKQDPRVRVVYVGQRGDHLADIPAKHPDIDEVYSVRAGKFRRYHGEGLKQLLDVRTIFLNTRDVFYVVAGIWQSHRLLKRLQPAVIFIKGGFVGVPVGLAAAQLKIPYITHDSDAVPGLANRIISRWATLHTVALPAEAYSYQKEITVSVGIPLQADFVPVNDQLKKRYREEIKVPTAAKMLFVIGGGLGAQSVNRAVGQAVPHLLREFPDLHIVHGAGRANESEMRNYYNEHLSSSEQGRVRVVGYISDVFRYSGAADLVITRAGATNLAEFAVQGKACVVIPAAHLTNGHQVKNARYLAEKDAAVVLVQDELEADPNRLAKLVSDLLSQPELCKNLGANLAGFAHLNAAAELAKIIIEKSSKHPNEAS